MAIKSVEVDFVARLAKFEEGIKRANAKLDQFQKKGDRTAALLKSSFKTLGTSIAGAFSIAGAKGLINFADSAADAAEQTGFTAQRIQELRYAADQSGIAMSTLDGAMSRFTKRLGLARRGAGAAAKTYKELGINLNRTNEEVFQEVVGVLGGMTNETNRLALATRLFGDDAQRMGVLLAGGNEGLKAFADKAHDLGLILSEEMVQNASDANDQLSTLSQVIKVQATAAIVSLAPVITDIAGKFIEASSAVRSFYDAFFAPEGSIGQKQQELMSVSLELARLRDIQSQLTADSNERSLLDRILGRESEAVRVQQAIDVVEKRFNELEAGLKTTSAAAKDTSGVNTQIDALSDLRQALERASAASQNYSETVKLFKEKQADPFKEDASNAEKISATYRALSAATSAAATGSEDAAQKVESAAAAINKLKDSGAVADQTIKDMKATLKEAFTAKEVAQPELIFNYDENNVLSIMDEATRKANIKAAENPVIFKAKLELDTSEAEARLAKYREAGSSNSFSDQTEKSGSKE